MTDRKRPKRKKSQRKKADRATAAGASPARPWSVVVDRAVGPDGSVLWPEYFSPAVVAALRRELGTYLFSAQYQNDPLPAEGGLVRSEWLRYVESPPEQVLVVQGVDPAISLADTADEFAHVTVTASADGNIVAVEAFSARLTFRQQIEYIEAAAARYRPVRIVIETVAYQQALRQELDRRSFLPVRSAAPRSSKAARVLRLAARMEAGKVAFLRGMDRLEEQLLGFPRARHDDLVDALAYAVEAAGRTFGGLPRRLRGV